jgi:hypothetical protein
MLWTIAAGVILAALIIGAVGAILQTVFKPAPMPAIDDPAPDQWTAERLENLHRYYAEKTRA